MYVPFLLTTGVAAAIASMVHPGNNSSNLREFLNTVLAGCSIAVNLEPNNQNSASRFEALVKHYEMDFQIISTFYLVHLTKENNIQLFGNGESGLFVEIRQSNPFWIFKKYATCHSQLHYFDSYEQYFQITLFRFCTSWNLNFY